MQCGRRSVWQKIGLFKCHRFRNRQTITIDRVSCLSREVTALEATTFGRFLQTDFHCGGFGGGQSVSIRVIAMGQCEQTFAQECLATTVAPDEQYRKWLIYYGIINKIIEWVDKLLFEESGGRDDTRLYLAVAQALAFVHFHFVVAGALKTSQFIVFLF